MVVGDQPARTSRRGTMDGKTIVTREEVLVTALLIVAALALVLSV